ncbi:pantetheine-phosphate adenylyltransferase [Salidesulfovibrio onnuriiensis]|uniref:pantetheine-phosphate adenylyltransferase n=1 Tax=Salidesulfovibrio onnuriiensis TaxID=2583823 RepID=UPI0011C957C3|nr:pantetheine-phosphate adenylyltransferase [Salidesulfovibrio onnuriiensis]
MAELNPRLAVYPGTFDPVTKGHVSLTKRGLKIFDQVVFAIARSTPKKTLFTLEERVDMAKQAFADEPNVIVEPFDGLLIDYVARRGAGSILRGLRAVSDFEYEFQMALMNRKLDRDIQTVFLMTDFKWMYLSSTIVKEVAKHGGNIKGLVPGDLIPKVYKRFAELKEAGDD